MQLTWEFSVVDVAVIVGIVIVIALFVVSFYLSRRLHRLEIDHKFFKERWQQIEDLLLKKGNEMNYKLAIIEADKLLDHALTILNFPGKTTAERLQFATYKHADLKHVWWAHKVRNMVVHEVKYEINSGSTRKVISLFKRALKTLDCL
ncbi:MAG: hypothetical protein UT32_C0006G0013 [Parcubacteria group bacterium GW2011_GWC2_39_14]|nr:MAG: hypothetical protein UT32_C0006G0013 [Parcubacteria group bacterium GW2011_GWC2_39_14]KKR54801.1 MAG: hypothetical protein UT91_C0009G0013 [Parcubacteria group bacterium GW2011_GWA2_40_23]